MPYVKNKIGEKFLKLVDKCFPKEHPLSKIINRNTIKISYKCMPSMKQEISRHNQQVQKGRVPTNPTEGCNCRAGRACPMSGNCLAKEVIYISEVVEDNGTTSTYTGLTGNTFKERFNGHCSTFRNRKEEHSTTLSAHIWRFGSEIV